jgi:hypothetical protein
MLCLRTAEFALDSSNSDFLKVCIGEGYKSEHQIIR